MALLTADCPRCGAAKMTFDVKGQAFRVEHYRWQRWFEVFSVCRGCAAPTMFLVGLKEYDAQGTFYKSEDAIARFEGSLNTYFEILRYISLRDQKNADAPEHLPDEIKAAFDEGATCLAVGCFNAAGTMFRLCLDLATRPLLPDPKDESAEQPKAHARHKLGSRLTWLFDQRRLPAELRDLADCVREDGNDGAHAGTLTKAEAEDLLEFTFSLLDQMISQPARIEAAKQRRVERRKT